MTAEIIVMNKLGVALAADSAGTASLPAYRLKRFSINKLFKLSKYHPVGIMVYGQSSLFGIPWEIIIKEYRKHVLKDDSFESLLAYGESFIQYLTKGNKHFTKEIKEEHIELIIKNTFIKISGRAKAVLIQNIQKSVGGSSNPNNDFSKILSDTIDDYYNELNELDNVNGFEVEEKDFKKKYKDLIKKQTDKFEKEYKNTQITQENIDLLVKIAYLVISKDSFTKYANSSGIVIAGYGEDEIYPSMVSYDIESISIENKLKYKIGDNKAVKDEKGKRAFVIPFAQEDTVRTFLAGVSPDYEMTIEEFMRDTLEQYPDKLLEKVENKVKPKDLEILRNELKNVGKGFLTEDFKKRLEEWRREKNYNPIIKAISILPIAEIASIAESIVNLTSIKRRMTLSPETVGGEVDVALITKFDGFIWIQRKFYFDPSKNTHYMANYYKGDVYGKEKIKSR